MKNTVLKPSTMPLPDITAAMQSFEKALTALYRKRLLAAQLTR
jgi:hypothetical protein